MSANESPANDTAASDDHGIEAAYYALDGAHWCTLVCLCGEQFRAPTWEEVGGDLDAHLEEHGEPAR